MRDRRTRRTHRNPRTHGLVALGALAMLAAGPARAQSQREIDQGSIKYRQSLMDAIGGDMGAMGAILKYGLPFPENLVVHANSLGQHAALIASAFERRVVEGPTDAKPAIWEKPDLFIEKTQALEDAAKNLADVASANPIDPALVAKQMKAVGDACGGCHDSFRKPKEESYKRFGTVEK
jgi:cytochrome c556